VLAGAVLTSCADARQSDQAAPQRARSAAPVVAAAPASAATSTANRGPVIVLDPGHSDQVHATQNGLDTSDYANEPEMRDVWTVAQLVRKQLTAAGYRVVMTKTRLHQKMSLGHRANIANRAHAALALSIHDQAGASGGVGFRRGNNIVYSQSVGTYRATRSGKRVYFRDKHVAAVSQHYGSIFRTWRHRVEHTSVGLRKNVGYNLGSRGLAPGNIWMVQLLSHVPWIYNESGGNSPGRVGLNDADKHTYANALVSAVEHCVPIPKTPTAPVLDPSQHPTG
jgi:N-acetylmuramoyl-L-alanine amidase